MNTSEEFKYKKTVFVIPFLFVFLIWFIYWLEINFQWNFNKHGIAPRTLNGFKGVFAAPFIHGDAKHLFNNSAPLFVLSSSLFYFYRKVATKVLLFGGILTGVLTWCIARPSYHIGVSGIVYLLFSFIFFSGVIKKHYRLIAMSLITIFLYGSMIWYLFPIKEGMSWEGHLSGFIIGLLLAIIYRHEGIVKKKHEFSITEFDTMFDDKGNYSPPVLIEDDETEEVFAINGMKVNYIYKEEEE